MKNPTHPKKSPAAPTGLKAVAGDQTKLQLFDHWSISLETPKLLFCPRIVLTVAFTVLQFLYQPVRLIGG